MASFLLDQYPSVRVLSNHGVGTKDIDVVACHSRGIKVGYTPEVSSRATADMTFTFSLLWPVQEESVKVTRLPEVPPLFPLT